MATFGDKLQISAFSAGLFLITNISQTYKLTNNIVPFTTYSRTKQCITYNGLLLHTLIFSLLSFLSMNNKTNMFVKLKHTLYGSLIYFFLSSPPMYSLTSRLLFGISQAYPDFKQVFLHSIIYCFLLILVMYLPEENK
jgi:hypothetical protein